MNKTWMMGILAACGMLLTLSGCAAVIFGGGSQPEEQAAEETAEAPAEASAQETQAEVDCDSVMQQLGETCYKTTAFEEDGTTPLHILDEAGNDMGEVDQVWAAAYCECYAQLAFQTFGCSGVISHEKLDDAAYAQTYEQVSNACIATVQEDENAQPHAGAVEDGAGEAAQPTESDYKLD